MGRPIKPDISDELKKTLLALGKNIVYFRQEMGMSQAELARKAKISTTTLNEVETCKLRDMRLSTLSSIAKTLDVSVSDLLAPSALEISGKDQALLLKASEAIARITKKLR